MRARFDEQLAQLNNELIEMGALCEEAIAITTDALNSNNRDIAKAVSDIEIEIDRKESNVESRCLKLLLQQQPVARDLRQISAALKMITDMERIGDQAADIAELVGYLEEHGQREESQVENIEKMGKETMTMVTGSVDAFVRKDLVLAAQVIDQDDIVDELFLKVRNDLIAQISQNPLDGEYILDLLMIAKYFERIGDHAVNLAEWVVFAVTGVHKES